MDTSCVDRTLQITHDIHELHTTTFKIMNSMYTMYTTSKYFILSVFIRLNTTMSYSAWYFTWHIPTAFLNGYATYLCQILK